eukprot:scaffold422_cov399-Prasinococcus_capsulatus_cf.AAC.18
MQRRAQSLHGPSEAVVRAGPAGEALSRLCQLLGEDLPRGAAVRGFCSRRAWRNPWSESQAPCAATLEHTVPLALRTPAICTYSPPAPPARIGGLPAPPTP